MQRCRLRVSGLTEPHGLAAVLRALADHDVTTLALDVQVVDGVPAAHELTLQLRRPLDLPHLAAVVERCGAEVVGLRPDGPADRIDPIVGALRCTTGLVSVQPPEEWVAGAAPRLVDAEVAWIANPAHPSTGGVTAEAASTWTTRRGREAARRSGIRPRWLVAVPLIVDDAPRVLVAARASAPFSDTEVARLEALAALTALTVDAPPTTRPVDEVRLADGGTIRIRRLAPSDRSAFLRMHRRCTAATLHRRYLAPTPALAPPAVDHLLDPDATGGVGLVAVVGSEIVAVFHGVTEGRSSAARVGMLVEDAHQRRGIGRAVLSQLAALLSARGVTELALGVLPDDDEVVRFVRACGLPARADATGGTLDLRVPCRSVHLSLAG